MSLVNDAIGIQMTQDSVRAFLGCLNDCRRKSQTRRLMKNQPGEEFDLFAVNGSSAVFRSTCCECCRVSKIKKGNVLYVREDHLKDFHGFYGYWADYDPKEKRNIFNGVSWDRESGIKAGSYWRVPGFLMKKEFARIWLRVNRVGVERLRGISNDDAWREGIPDLGSWRRNEGEARDEYIRWFFELHKPLDPMVSNPWVWVYEVEVIHIGHLNCS